MNLFLASFNATMRDDSFGDEVGGVYSSLRTVMNLINKFQPHKVIFCFDGKGGNTARQKIFSEYKANRHDIKDSSKITRFDRQKEATNQLKKLWLYLDNLPVQMIIANGMEADDAIAYIATNCLEEYNKIIISNDKDFYQLVSDNIKVYSNTKKKLFSKQVLLNDFNILPENFIIYRTIDGDKSDNVPGVHGIGLKTINKLFPELAEQYISLDDMFAMCNERTGINKKYKELLDNRDTIERNFKLMQLNDCSNGILTSKDKMYLKEKLFNDDINGYNFPMLKSFMLQDGFMLEIKKAMAWNNTFSFLNSMAIKHNKTTRE